MSQKQFLESLDAMLHGALQRAGVADQGTYRHKDMADEEPGSPCSVYVNRDVQLVGELQQVQAGRIEVGYVLASFDAGVEPLKGGSVTVDGDRYVNDQIAGDDGSIRTFVCRRAANG